MPAGCTHEFVNTGDVPLVHLLVASPVSIDPDSLIDKTRPLPGSSANSGILSRKGGRKDWTLYQSGSTGRLLSRLSVGDEGNLLRSKETDFSAETDQ